MLLMTKGTRLLCCVERYCRLYHYVSIPIAEKIHNSRKTTGRLRLEPRSYRVAQYHHHHYYVSLPVNSLDSPRCELSKLLAQHIQKLHRASFRRNLKAMEFYQVLRSHIDGHADTVQILNLRIKLLERLENLVLRSEVSAKEIEDVVSKVLMDTVGRIIYVGIIHCSHGINSPKLIVVYQRETDVDKVRLCELDGCIPKSVRHWFLCYEQHDVRRKVGGMHWEGIQNFLLSSRTDILVTEHWRALQDTYIKFQQNSKRLLRICIIKLEKIVDGHQKLNTNHNPNTINECRLSLLHIKKIYGTEFYEDIDNAIESLKMYKTEEHKKALRGSLSKVLLRLDGLGPFEEDIDQEFAVTKTWKKEKIFFRNHNHDNEKNTLSTLALKLAKSMQHKIGGPLLNIQPADILLVARSGSHLYNLSLPSSDLDYIVIYRASLKDIRDTFVCEKENVETVTSNHHVQFNHDCKIYEAQKMCESIYKCDIVLAELVLAGHAEYVHPLMQELFDQPEHIICEKLIRSWLGIIYRRMNIVSAPKVARKHLYLSHHKLFCLFDILQDKRKPHIQVTGQRREHLMKMRCEENEGEYSIESLRSSVVKKYKDLSRILSMRDDRLPEAPNLHLISRWLEKVRGVDSPSKYYRK